MLLHQSTCMLMTYSFLIFCPKNIRSTDSTSSKERAQPENPPSLRDDEMTKPAEQVVDRSDVEMIKENNREEKGFDLSESEIQRFKIWPQGVVPYFIDDFSFDKVLRDRIRRFLDNYNAMTGIQFIELPRPPEDSQTSRWVLFINRIGALDCIDHPTLTFTNSGVQRIVLGYDCLNDPGDIAAIMLALLGVPPQHNAPNRDDYIKVETQNIMPETRSYFNKLSDSEWLFHDLPYDYSSASHYTSHAYTLHGSASITPRVSLAEPLGEAKSLSEYDIKKIKMLYNYIIATKSTYKAAQCSKLFKPGAKLSKYKPKTKTLEVEARPKPAKYLQMPKNKNKKLRLHHHVYEGPGFNDKSDPLHALSDYYTCSDSNCSDRK